MRAVTFLATLLIGLSAVFAQPLVDRVPDDAMIYVGWKGTETLGDAYQASHLRAIVDASDWPAVFNEFLPAIVAKAGKDDPRAAEKLRTLTALAGPLWRHESAFYFGGLIAGQQGGPPSPKLAILVRAGAESAELVTRINDAIAKAGRLPVPVKAAAYNDLVAVTTGAWPGFEALLGAHSQVAAAPALKASAKFTAAMAQVNKDPVSTIYVDAEALVKMADGFLALGGKPEQQRNWRKARQIVGLGGMRQFVLTGGFDGKDWVAEGFLGAPAPRQGLLALMDGASTSEDTLKLIPQDVLMATAGRFDLAKLVSQARTSVAEADAEWGNHVNEAIAAASQWAGLDIARDVLAPMPDQWAAYVSPTVGGDGLLGFCLAARPRDAQKLEASLGILEKRASDAINQQTRGQASVSFKTRKVGDITLHYLAVPLVTPTWAIVDGTMYVALYPQVVSTAAAHAKANGPTILQNEKFAAVRKRLGQDKFNSVTFSDLPRTAPMAYSSWLFLSRYAGFADVFGIDSPLMLMPPIDRLMPELAPSGQISWCDDAGGHVRMVTPFPGADALAQDPLATAMTAQPAIMMSILLPSLNRARENANRVKSAANLRMIGQGMMLYANEHKGNFPATLGEVSGEDLAAEVFTSPSSNTKPPHEVPDKAKLVEWINENADYVYLGDGKTSSASPDVILAYEKPEIHGTDGFGALFGDGHVEWLAYDDGMKRVAKQVEKDKAAK